LHAEFLQQGSGSATFSQYLSWHSLEDVVNPLSDWTTNGYWDFGEKDGVYRRNSDGNDSVTDTLAGTHIVNFAYSPGMTTGPTDRGFGKRGPGSDLSASNLTYAVTGEYSASGTPQNVSITFAVPREGTKPADWSAINFQYWAASGSRMTDITWSEINWWYRMSYNVDLDYSYWVTFKLWTGTDGYGNLGNCPCASSDYYDVEGDSCGGAGEAA
jgi:hypothetical protein